MKSKTIVLISSSILAVSILLTGVIVTQLKNNRSNAGTPVSALELGKVEDFPEISVYPDASLINSTKEDIGEGKIKYSGNWVLGGDNLIEEVINWYREDLVSQGWQEDGDLIFNRNGQILDLRISRGKSGNRYAISIEADVTINK